MDATVTARSGGSELVIDLPDPDQSEELAFETVVCRTMVATLQQLPMAARVVVALHYYGEIELQQVAKMMDITESRASHLHTDAVLSVHAALVKVAASG
jgi:DNA-directed RNA polymerase specialized sigma subunit